MAHNLEYNVKRGTYSFFSRKELAWHGLGQVIDNTVTPEEALKLANLDYEVELFPIYANFIPPKGRAELNGDGRNYNMINKDNKIVRTIPFKGKLIKDNFTIVRTDTYNPLGIVGNRYTPVQNKESITFIYDILKNNPDIKEHDDIIIETAGALGNGSRIFVTAKLPKGFKIGEETDYTELYIVFTNSHDGTSSLTAMITPIRVVCNNTLSAALGNNKSKVSFRHTANIKQSLSQGLELLNLSYINFDTNRQLYNSMLKIKVDDNLIFDLCARALLPDNKYLLGKEIGFTNLLANNEHVSTRLKNQLDDMIEYVDKGAGQNTNRGTLYWGYMGINSYINNGINFKDYEAKFDNLIGGNSQKLDERVLNFCKQLV